MMGIFDWPGMTSNCNTKGGFDCGRASEEYMDRWEQKFLEVRVSSRMGLRGARPPLTMT